MDVAAKMREAALKSSIFIGVPRVRSVNVPQKIVDRRNPIFSLKTILSLAAMTEAFEDDVRNKLRKESLRYVITILFSFLFSNLIQKIRFTD